MSLTLTAPERRVFRASALAALLVALGLGALGRFREAAALTAGAAVAIVSGLWLSDVAGTLLVPRPRAATRTDWKFAFRALLRYAFVGVAAYGSVRLFPGEVPWLLGGLSAVVLGVVVEGFRGAAAGRSQPEEDEDGTNPRG
ncbi:MAG: hypothetical protein KJ062_17045 [Thermoanaerobaculia bacterium]|nr:hypothetical protein [Thermoanaerobaculia bacterium]